MYTMSHLCERAASSARRDHWPRVTRDGRSRGQALVIFALSFTVLLGFAGLSIDSMRVYDLYVRAQRAAEAGALAGVMYMPCYYNSSSGTGTCSGFSPDGKSATERAMQEVYRNGFGTLPSGPVLSNPCPTPVSATPVAVCAVSNKTTDLEVSITQTISFFLLSTVGISSATFTASGQADYLPPIQMGARTNYFGDQGECQQTRSGVTSIVACSPNDTSLTHQQNFLASVNGPAELKEQGDPYVYCEEGPSQAPPGDSGNYTTYDGFSTNHAQWPGGDPRSSGYCGPSTTGKGNSDQQPAGFTGPATRTTSHPGAYNYYISVGGGSGTKDSLWVYTPNYIPTDTGSTSSADSFLGPYNTFGGLTFNGYFDDPSLYFNVTYTLFSVPLTYLRSSDVQLSTRTFAPYDMMTYDLYAHGCYYDGSQVYLLNDANTTYSNSWGIDTSGAHCQSVSSILTSEQCSNLWCNITPTAGLAAGTYRLAVEVTGIKSTVNGQSASLFGWGSKSYGVKLCNSGVSNPIGCTTTAQSSVASWNNMDVIFQSPASAYFDLACIPQQFAGRSINIGLFDVGDSSYNVYFRLVPPAGSGVTIQYPTGIRTGTDNTNQQAVLASKWGDRIYNGLWITTQVTLPPTYNGSCTGSSTGWWQIYYSTTGGPPHDKVAVSFSLIGSPVHLVLPG